MLDIEISNIDSRNVELKSFHFKNSISVYNLTKVDTEEEAIDIRKSNLDGNLLILKSHDELFYAVTNKALKVSYCPHICASCNNRSKCRIQNDEDASFFLNDLRYKNDSTNSWMYQARRIEKYEFVKLGIQVIEKGRSKYLAVFECQFFQEVEKKCYNCDCEFNNMRKKYEDEIKRLSDEVAKYKKKYPYIDLEALFQTMLKKKISNPNKGINQIFNEEFFPLINLKEEILRYFLLRKKLRRYKIAIYQHSIIENVFDEELF